MIDVDPLLTKNVVALQKGFCLFDKGRTSENNAALAATIQAELMNLGWMLDESAYNALLEIDPEEAIRFHNETIAWLKQIMGVGNYRPLYDGFPKQVMETSEIDLFLNAIRHYASCGTFIPDSYTETLPSVFEKTSFKTIALGTEKRLMQVFSDLLAVEQSLAPSDREILQWFSRHYSVEELTSLLPKSIPFKENLCLLVGELGIVPRYMTTTDALRVVVYKSGGDVVLPPRCEPIRKFDRPQRRRLLDMLEYIELKPEEMLLQDVRWKKVGEVLHPGEYAKRYPKTFKAFDDFRNRRVKTWQSRMETERRLTEKLRILSERPGEFARRLDALLRAADPENNVSNNALSRIEKARQRRETREFLRKKRQEESRKSFVNQYSTGTPIEKLFRLYWLGNRGLVDGQEPLFSVLEKRDKERFLDEYRKYLRKQEAERAKRRKEPRTVERPNAETIDDSSRQYLFGEPLLWKGVETPNLQKESSLRDSEKSACSRSESPNDSLNDALSSEEPFDDDPKRTTPPPFTSDRSPEGQIDEILQAFEQVASSVSCKVLLELYAHFDARKESRQRNILLKGRRKLISLPQLTAMKPELVDKIQRTIVAALKSRYSKLPPLGKCWLDPKLRGIPLPTNMRSVSKGMVPAVRGLRIPVDNPDAKVIRLYVHWKDPDGTQDLDLSSTFIGSNSIDFISWNKAYVRPYGTHSGDVRRRKGDCAEYVDIVIEEARKMFDYVVVDVRNYMAEPLRNVAPVFGYMEREFPVSDLLWYPKTVKNSFLMTSDKSSTIVLAFDLHKMEYVTLDLDSNSVPVASQDISTIMNVLLQYMEPPRVSVYDLLTWHIQARGGKIVPDEEKNSADILFSSIDFMKDYVNILKWMGDNDSV